MGKRTTTRHKEDNTFRFQTFEEKLRKISVNVNLSIRDGRGENPEGDETYFSQEIEKWVDLNRTEAFADLLCKIGTDARTLAQLLLNKDKFAKILLEHLQNAENVVSFEPTFALVIALSRDLGEEFYPHFQDFFNVIIKIVMESKNTSIIEAGFKCYAYLSKYLRRQIIRDLHQHMKMFSVFLDPKLKTYVMIFACEAFSIVAGKFARDHPEKFLELLFGVFLRPHPEHAVGVATLLFAVFKGVAGTLKLEGPGMHFKECVNFLDYLEDKDEAKIWTDVLCHLVARLLNHANASSSEKLISLIENILSNCKKNESSFPNILTVYITLIEFNDTKKITNVPNCANVLHQISSQSDSCRIVSDLLTRAVVSIVEAKCSTNDTETLSLLHPVIVDLLKVASLTLLETLDKCLRSYRAYFRMFLEPIVTAYARIGDLPFINDCPNITVYCLSEAICQQGGLYLRPETETHFLPAGAAPMRYFDGQRRVFTILNASNIKGHLWDCCAFLKEMSEEVNAIGISDSKAAYYLRLLITFSRLNSKNCSSCLQFCIDLLSKLVQGTEKLNVKITPLIFYILQVFISQVSMQATFYDSVPVKELLEFLSPYCVGASSKECFSPWCLKTLDILVYFINVSGNEKHCEVLKEFIRSEWDTLGCNLESGFRMLRALTLSILRNTVDLVEFKSEKMVEILDKFLELEDMAVTDTKFSSLAKSTLTECKVIVGSENYDVNLKLLCLKFTLGVMYTNYSLVWTPSVEVLQHSGKHVEMAKHWKIFGRHFRMNQSYPGEVDGERIRTMFLPVISVEDSPDFLDAITIDCLGLPRVDAGYSEPEEHIDMTQYKVNLWLSLKGQPLTREEYNADVRQFVDDIIEGPKDDEQDKDERRERAKMIVPVLQFLESCDLVNVNHDLWEAALKFLTHAPDVQKAAWKFLFAKRKSKLKNYKEDIDEILNSDSMDPVHKFRLDAIDVSLNKQYENETAERRALLMDLIIRILIGKERVMKGEKRTQVLRFLAGCSEADAQKYLDLTVGTAQEVRQLPPKVIEIKINKMTSALRIWRYKFPNILDQMIHGFCDLVSAIRDSLKPISRKSLDQQEEIPDDVFEEQKRAALKAGRICVVAFFSALPRLDITEQTISRIFEVFIWPALDDITETSVGSVSWILKLFLVWSTYERYHVLLTKCKDGDVHRSPMWRMFDLLDSKSAIFEVKKYILGIILNLSNPPEVTDDSAEEVTEDYLNCTNAPLKISRTYQFETTESLGINIILLRKEVILNLFQDVHTFKRLTGQSGGGNCLALISLIAGFSSGGEVNEKLCGIIIDTFQMYKNNEENLYNSIVSVGKLLSSLDNKEQLLLKLGPTFSWMKGRRLRTALVEALGCIKERDDDLFQIINGMNSWTDTADDTPDFIARQESFDKAEKFVVNGEFDLLAYALIFHNCIFNVTHEEDLGVRNAAKTLLKTVSSVLPEKSAKNVESKNSVHKFLDSIALPKLRSGVHEKDDKRYEDLLRVLFSFTESCKELHGTFKELAKLVSLEIIEGLCDIQVHLRTRAMNRLCKTLNDAVNDVSPAVIQAYVLPIATHNLFDEDRLSKNYNELIDSSIEVLKAVMCAVSHEQYFSYLNRLLDDPKKNTRLAKQFERVLIAIMDAFHFDLSLACPEEKKESEVKSTSLVPQNAEQEAVPNAVATSEPKEDEESESEGEEFKIPDESPVKKLTLVPQAAAVKCLGILKAQIIPKLRKFLHFEETATHKLSRATKTVDDDVILKIPCTIALVKLLKKIPKSEGQNGIRSIIPSITAGLRNELLSVRNTLRKTLLSVVKELGTSHLRSVVSYMKSSLQRGYQKHVLNYSVGYLLRCLENELRAEPHHVPVKEVLSLCEEELFGQMHEEKDVQAIKQKTREASRSNAAPILKACAKCVSSIDQLNALIDPAVKHITEKKSLKVAKSSRQWLMSVSEGLADNNSVNQFQLLDWLLEVIKKDGSKIGVEGENEDGEDPPSKKRKLLETPKDSKLIPVLKKKTVSEGKLAGQNFLAEFAFTCLYNGMNKGGSRFREKLKCNQGLSLLDSFIPFLVDGIKGASKQVNIVALRCLTLLLEFDLANFKKPEVIDKMQRNGFVAMSTHCYRNTTDSEMTNATFKFISAFFVRFPDFKITLQDFELMLKCIQGYLTDGNCSSAALTLLKSVLQNKYKCKILPDLMQEVFKQCITSYYQHVNEGCRLAYLVYLNNYLTNPKDLYVEVQLILRQFDYQHEGGRVTAAGILNSLLQSIPEDCFEEIKELVFLKLLASLDKEKQPKVRSQLGECIKSLFKLEKRKSLVRILLKLLVLDKHVPELDTFFLIVGLLIDDARILSNEDVNIVIDRIKAVLDPDSLDQLCSSHRSRITQQIKDYMIFQAMVALKKALNRSVFDTTLWSSTSPLADQLKEIFVCLRTKYLDYEHEWVPLITVDILSICLNQLQLSNEDVKVSVAHQLEIEQPVSVFLENKEDLQAWISELWSAMKKSDREDMLAKGAYALVLLISVAARFTEKDVFVEAVSTMRKGVNGEVVHNPKVTTIRTVALGCFRGIAKTCPRDAIEQTAEIMTRVAVRELTDDNVPQEVKNECEKLISVLRDVMGHSEFNIMHAKVNDFFYKKRNLNRAKKKEAVMLHPGLVRKRPKNAKPNLKGKKKRKVK